MTYRCRPPYLWLALAAFVGPSVMADDAGPSFNRDVRPILAEHCYQCHGPDARARKADLRLDQRASSTAPRADGPAAVVPGRPEKSEILARVTSGDEDDRMPPPDHGRDLSPAQVETIRRWIAAGAKWQEHWALIPPVRVPPPAVKHLEHVRNPIDRFVQARLEAQGIAPSPAASMRTLARRVTLDLLGLPPTPKEVRSFVADDRPGAYDRLVERLLASPHFGERMAAGWLDLVRYADTVGYHSDVERSISLYRDYVIRAFNQNLPFDQFTREQLAGDLLPDPTPWQLVASGYNMLGMSTEEGGAQPKEYTARHAADRVRNLGSVWMGATLGCVECHDHKYDSYTQKDFYSLAAFFADVDQPGVGTPKPSLTLESPSGSTRKTIVTRRNAEPRVTRILRRGDWMDGSGPVVAPGAPSTVLPTEFPPDRRPDRLDLARWLLDPRHPQTARVFVNRLWRKFFGAGLSDSVDDLGVQGEWPTHPELLDWLAVEFVESGWDVKHVVRLIVTSETYRRASEPRDDLAAIDPANRLLARQSSFRCDAETIRDLALAASGLLARRIGGESVRPYQPAGYWRFLNFPTRDYVASRGPNQYRRGLYTHWQRTLLHPSLLAFDAPTREVCTAKRPTSNTPQAALVLLNDPTYVEAARAIAASSSGSPADRIQSMFERVVGRRASAEETAILLDVHRRHADEFGADVPAAREFLAVGDAPLAQGMDPVDLAAWTSVARVLLNLDETITRD